MNTKHHFNQLFNNLVTAFRSERFAESERLAEALLKDHPNDERLLYIKAQSINRQGRIDEAIDLMKKLLEVNPLEPAFHNDYGAMLAAANQWAEAEAAYRMALSIDPNGKDAKFNLALALFKQKQPEQAIKIVDSLIPQFPDLPDLYSLRGQILRALKHPTEAVTAFSKAMALGINDPETQTNFGIALHEAGKTEEALATLTKIASVHPVASFYAANLLRLNGKNEEAISYFKKAIEQQPDFADAYNNLGLALQEKGEILSAKEAFEKAITYAPDLSAAYCNLGNCMIKLDEIEKALEHFEHALKLDPNSPIALSNIGQAHHQLFQLKESERAFRQALAIDPNCQEAKLNLGILLLLKGNYEEGWPLYETRWQMPKLRDQKTRFTQPEWKGESLAEKTLLIYAEQGFGDCLEFIRYLALVREKYPSAKLYYASQAPLIRIFSDYAKSCEVTLLPMALEEGLPPIDYHIGLLTLPLILGTTLDNIPAKVPYLTPPSPLALSWKEKLESHLQIKNGKRIGIVWSSGEAYQFHKTRTMRLKQFKPLFELPGINWVSLQKGPSVSQIKELGLDGLIINLMDEAEDFADTAAIIENLDLLISVDTSVPHLAGAMGKPVWLLDRLNTDWRWLLNRTDSPWYPSMQLFRQKKLGEWETVIDNVRKSLETWVSPPSAPSKQDSDKTTAGSLKLNLGCGKNKLAGFINIDKSANYQPDLTLDLEKTPWPLEDCSVSEIRMTHVLEFLGKDPDTFLSIMKELYRISQNGTKIEIHTTHPRSDLFISDPAHVRPITPELIRLFSKTHNEALEKDNLSGTPYGMMLDVDFEIETHSEVISPEWQAQIDNKAITEDALWFTKKYYYNIIQKDCFVLSVKKIVPEKSEKPQISLDEKKNIAETPLPPIEQEEDSLESLLELATSLRNKKDISSALACYEKILTIDEKNPEAYLGMGNAFSEAGWHDDAERAYQTALSFSPDLTPAQNALALCKIRKGEYRGAIEILEHLSEQHPDDVKIMRTQATAYSAIGHYQKAEALCKRAIELSPEDPNTHFILGTNLMINGYLEKGWEEMEYRWKATDPANALIPVNTNLPKWNGEIVDKESDCLIIHAEQGFGDCIQFARYTELASQYFKRVLLQTRVPLLSLFKRSFGHYAEVVSNVDSEEGYTYYCPQMSLPHAFSTKLETIPANTPYLLTEPSLVEKWRNRLGIIKSLKIGIAWNTGKHPMHKASFEVPLHELSPLFSLPGILWVSLNKNETSTQDKEWLERSGVIDWTSELNSFDDTAALMENLDLVISVDTAAAHLAGALNIPVWLMNRAESEWRWLLKRTDSPWYPSMRIFRQTEFRQWQTVIFEIRKALLSFKRNS